MPATAALVRSLTFWHWYPELLLKDLSADQLRWQPEGNDSSITFATWHTYRAADDLCNGYVLKRPTVFSANNWAARLPVVETGRSAFGNGLTREQIGQLKLDPAELVQYAKEIGESLAGWVSSATDAEMNEEIGLPFFTAVYPGYDKMSKVEAVSFFAIGHTAEHLGEVQLLKGLMGLKGAPL